MTHHPTLMTPLLTAAGLLASALAAVALLALRFWLIERDEDQMWQATMDAVAERYDIWTDADGREWATLKMESK